MPLAEAGFKGDDTADSNNRLVQYGPTLQVVVSHYDQAKAAPVPEPSKMVYALIDTGANQSHIDEEVAKALGLPVVDKCQISGISGAVELDVYLAHITIPQLDLYQYGTFAAVKMVAGGQNHEVLLGRTFLQSVIMIYDGLRAQVSIASNKVTQG